MLLTVRNVSNTSWVWPWGDEGPERVAPGQVIDVELLPPARRQPNETSLEYRARLEAELERGDERVAYLGALFRAGKMLSVDAPAPTVH